MSQFLNILAVLIVVGAIFILLRMLSAPYALKAAGITILFLLGVGSIIWAVARILDML